MIYFTRTYSSISLFLFIFLFMNIVHARPVGIPPGGFVQYWCGDNLNPGADCGQGLNHLFWYSVVSEELRRFEKRMYNVGEGGKVQWTKSNSRFQIYDGNKLRWVTHMVQTNRVLSNGVSIWYVRQIKRLNGIFFDTSSRRFETSCREGGCVPRSVYRFFGFPLVLFPLVGFLVVPI
jgi:hypothetical protein